MFRICLLNNIANPANLHPDWAKLVVLRFNIQNSTATKYSTYLIQKLESYFRKYLTTLCLILACDCCCRFEQQMRSVFLFLYARKKIVTHCSVACRGILITPGLITQKWERLRKRCPILRQNLFVTKSFNKCLRHEGPAKH